jgi:ketosteroid isomerase-like protein
MMRRLILLMGLMLLSISAAKAGPNEDAVAARATWEQVYNAGDADKFAALYTKDAMLFGTTAQLFTGTDGARTYFSKLPAGIKVKMGDQQAIAAGPDVLLSSGFADFTLANGAVPPDTCFCEGRRQMAGRPAPRLARAEVRPPIVTG